jgi:hypothetical protein
MPRPKGLPKTGGRVRGTPNKTTKSVMEKLDELGCDPIEGLAGIAMNTNTAPELKVRCYLELAQYVYPKRKAVDLSVEKSDGVVLSLGNVPIPREFLPADSPERVQIPSLP